MEQTQLDLLSRIPRSRKADPASSHEAEHGFKTAGHQASHAQACLELVRRYPGLTGAEYAEKAAQDPAFASFGLDQVSIQRRLPELRELRLVFNPTNAEGKRRLKHCTVKDRRCLYWLPTERQRAAA